MLTPEQIAAVRIGDKIRKIQHPPFGPYVRTVVRIEGPGLFQVAMDYGGIWPVMFNAVLDELELVEVQP